MFRILKTMQIGIGGLGVIRFEKGIYAYTGSALGRGASSLECRIRRHLSEKKKIFWHIDYLLAHEKSRIIDVVCARTNQNVECEVFKNLSRRSKVTIPVKRFGASDCRSKCDSHLCHIKATAEEALQKIMECYQEARQEPKRCKGKVLQHFDV